MEYQLESKAQVKEVFKEPPRCRVILLNDDFTTKDFVVAVLISVFNKGEEEAVAIMNRVHTRGKSAVGEYTYDVALSLASRVREIAEQNSFPLQCVVEEV